MWLTLSVDPASSDKTNKSRSTIKQLQKELKEKEEMLLDAKALILDFQGNLTIFD